MTLHLGPLKRLQCPPVGDANELCPRCARCDRERFEAEGDEFVDIVGQEINMFVSAMLSVVRKAPPSKGGCGLNASVTSSPDVPPAPVPSGKKSKRSPALSHRRISDAHVEEHNNSSSNEEAGGGGVLISPDSVGAPHNPLIVPRYHEGFYTSRKERKRGPLRKQLTILLKKLSRRVVKLADHIDIVVVAALTYLRRLCLLHDDSSNGSIDAGCCLRLCLMCVLIATKTYIEDGIHAHSLNQVFAEVGGVPLLLFNHLEVEALFMLDFHVLVSQQQFFAAVKFLRLTQQQRQQQHSKQRIVVASLSDDDERDAGSEEVHHAAEDFDQLLRSVRGGIRCTSPSHHVQNTTGKATAGEDPMVTFDWLFTLQFESEDDGNDSIRCVDCGCPIPPMFHPQLSARRVFSVKFGPDTPGSSRPPSPLWLGSPYRPSPPSIFGLRRQLSHSSVASSADGPTRLTRSLRPRITPRSTDELERPGSEWCTHSRGRHALRGPLAGVLSPPTPVEPRRFHQAHSPF